MKANALSLKQVDHQLLPLKDSGLMHVPKKGWINTLRKSLGMTIKQLAHRLQVNPSRVVKMETAEVEGGITIKSMRSVAEQMDSVFVYGFVPKTSFEEFVREQAYEFAKRMVLRTAHTMSLEAQTVDPDFLEQQTKLLAEELLQKSWKHLWQET